MMERAFNILFRVSSLLNWIAAVALTFMMLLTVADVFMRAGGSPFIGTYEIVNILMGLVIGFGIPKVSLDRGHVSMEFLQQALSKKNRAILNTFTRILCIVLFVLIGYNLIGAGREFRLSGEVSPTMQLPFFPIAYGVGICCFIECLVFLFDIAKIWKAQNE
ncbi:MAG: TRAP transporter small permease [Deltaproteobacteria bacterium HGW-Deltaproteobacteria-15]|jgi:TRAP-type C4-dicarboxylate transport system permease small subunit|nr:MAG: TRAP transporter small permease [Deltaproteobacteria bacterium HGW-Deltaproteobacteria-15]